MDARQIEEVVIQTMTRWGRELVELRSTPLLLLGMGHGIKAGQITMLPIDGLKDESSETLMRNLLSLSELGGPARSYYKFTVEGDPVPHLSVTARSSRHPGNKKAKAVAEYKARCRNAALAARVVIPMPTVKAPALIQTRAFFRTGNRGGYAIPLYDSQRPRVEVEIRF